LQSVHSAEIVTQKQITAIINDLSVSDEEHTRSTIKFTQ